MLFILTFEHEMDVVSNYGNIVLQLSLHTLGTKKSTVTFEKLHMTITVCQSLYVTDSCFPRLTIAASFHLAHPVEGICDQVGESPIQVHGGQTALVPIPGCNQLGQIAVHVLYHATDVQLP